MKKAYQRVSMPIRVALHSKAFNVQSRDFCVIHSVMVGMASICVCVTINNGHCEQESESVVGPFCHISLAGSCRDLSKHLRHWRISVSIMNTSTRHLSIITLISSHMSSIFDINLD